MHKLIIITILFVTMTVQAQKPITFESADSISYQYYLVGDWDKLINFGNEAILQGVEFKSLYQRMGYANFVKQRYYDSQLKYEKALTYDQSDVDTKLMLYHCGLNIGDNVATRFQANKLPKETQQKLGLKPVKYVNAVDVEYNYKANDDSTGTRSNANYYRIGVSTQLGYRLNLYQAVSRYLQTVNVSTSTIQNDYYGLLNWALNSHSSLDIAYHYTYTDINPTFFSGNMFFAQLSTRNNHFSYGINGSVLSDLMGNYKQIGLSGGCNFGNNGNVYLKSSLNYLLNSTSSHFIYSQTIGTQISKKTWVEGSITLGNLKNYNDNKGLYLYNSLDATTFRTGVTIFQQLTKNISLFGNYSYDKKELIDTNNTNTNYNQHSFSTGIIWKL
ncbi:MAG TPA: hypothetical protein VIK29_00365 [Paludibacter sp.]